MVKEEIPYPHNRRNFDSTAKLLGEFTALERWIC
jgi:hypothetical protein